jgi:hypothetical protein
LRQKSGFALPFDHPQSIRKIVVERARHSVDGQVLRYPTMQPRPYHIRENAEISDAERL